MMQTDTNILNVACTAVSPHHYIDDLRMASAKKFELQSQIAQRLLGWISEGTAEHVEAAITAAQKAFPAWSTMTAAESKPYLNRIADEIGQRAGAFCQLESNDAGVLLSRMRHGVVPRAMLNISWFETHFVEHMHADVEKLNIGDPRDEATEIGPIIHPRQVERVRGFVERSMADGAQLLWGGEPHYFGAQYYQPTDSAEDRRVAFGFDERVPEPFKANYATAAKKMKAVQA